MNVKEVFSHHPGIKKLKYTDFYQRYFSLISPNILLEIGVAGGQSLRAWKEMFPNAKVIGLDIDPNCAAVNSDLLIYTGDQKDTNLIEKILTNEGVPDVVIDDGGHKRSEQLNTFTYLYPKLPKPSLYIIEDLQTNYLPNWNDFPITIIDHLKSMIGDKYYTSMTFEPTNGQLICVVKK